MNRDSYYYLACDYYKATVTGRNNSANTIKTISYYMEKYNFGKNNKTITDVHDIVQHRGWIVQKKKKYVSEWRKN